MDLREDGDTPYEACEFNAAWLEKGRLDVNVHVFPGVSSLSNTFNKKKIMKKEIILINKERGKWKRPRAEGQQREEHEGKERKRRRTKEKKSERCKS